MENTRSTPSKQDDSRGQQNMVAIILLFGMVFVGATVIFLAGGTLIDALQTNIGTEQVQSTMGAVDNSIWSAAAGGGVFALPEDGYDRIEATDNGEVSVAWHDEAEPNPGDLDEDIDWEDEVESDLGELRLIYDNSDGDFAELESTAEETVVAHQGGGIWEAGDNGVRIQNAPDVGVNPDGSVRLNFMKIDQEEVGSSPSSVQGDDVASTKALEDLAAVASDPPENKDHFVIRVESEYAEGWERHFEAEAADVAVADFKSGNDDDVVYLIVEGIGALETLASFAIEEENGLSEQGGGEIENNEVYEGDMFYIDSKITNIGSEESSVSVDLTIWDPKNEVTIEKRTIESSGDVSEDGSINTNDGPGGGPNGWDWVDVSGNPEYSFTTATNDERNIGDDLEPGNRYEYNIETDPGSDSLTQNGTFYYVAENPSYIISEAQDSTEDETIEIGGTVQNIGEDAEDRPVDLTISPVDSDQKTTTSTALGLEQLQESTVSWEIDQTQWPNGEYEYTVSTENDPDGEGGTFNVTEGGALEITEDLGVDEDDLVNGTSGQVVAQDGTASIGVNLTNTFTEPVGQTVTLEIYDDEADVAEDEPTKTVERPTELNSEQSKEIDLEFDTDELEGGLHEYVIATENDRLTEPGSFFLDEDGAELDVQISSIFNPNDDSDDAPPKPAEPLTVLVDVENVGKDGEQLVILEDYDGEFVDGAVVDLDADESDRIELEWGSLSVPASAAEEDREVTVRSPTHSSSTDVPLEPLVLVEDVTVENEYISPGDSATVTAEIEFVGHEAIDGSIDEEIRLEGGEGTDSKTVEQVPTDGTEFYEFEYQSDGITERVTVSTGDDEGDDVVIVRRADHYSPLDDCDSEWVDYGGGGGDPYEISNVYELQCIEEHGTHHDYVLVDDIEAHGTEYWNDGAGFEPLAAQNRNGGWFSGDFDGQGHKIKGLTINRPGEAFVGLFATTDDFDGAADGRVGDGVTIENIRLVDIDVHGKTVVGGLVGGAGGTIKNTSVDGIVQSEYQQVGGIAGHGHDADLNNQLVSTATVTGGGPSARADEHPWQNNNNDPNLGVGGIIGGTGFETDVSTAYATGAVSGNSATGGIIGWTSDYSSTNEQMYFAGGTVELEGQYDVVNRNRLDDDVQAGAIAGRMEVTGDTFRNSVYSDEQFRSIGEQRANADDISRSDAEMRGPSVLPDDQDDEFYDQYPGVTRDDAEGTMANLDWEIWEPVYEFNATTGEIENEDYPRFAWELEAEGAFDVEITDSPENVTAGDRAEIAVTVTSLYQGSADDEETQTIRLIGHDGETVDTRSVDLPSTTGTDETKNINLTWQTDLEDNGTDDIAVRSEDAEDTESLTVEASGNEPGSSDGPSFGEVSGGTAGPADGVDTNTGSTGDSSVSQFPTDIEIEIGAVRVS